MEEIVLKLSLSKVIELILNEQRADIKKFYTNTVGQSAGDILDTYVPSDSPILNTLKALN